MIATIELNSSGFAFEDTRAELPSRSCAARELRTDIGSTWHFRFRTFITDDEQNRGSGLGWPPPSSQNVDQREILYTQVEQTVRQTSSVWSWAYSHCRSGGLNVFADRPGLQTIEGGGCFSSPGMARSLRYQKKR